MVAAHTLVSSHGESSVPYLPHRRRDWCGSNRKQVAHTQMLTHIMWTHIHLLMYSMSFYTSVKFVQDSISSDGIIATNFY